MEITDAAADITDISAVLITRDAARTIDPCLRALHRFAEVVVCDTGSVDDTIARARRHRNVRVFEIEFDGFGAAKTAAVAKARCDWIFSIDADEIVDDELARALARWEVGGDRHRLGVIDRRNFFLGRHIRRGGLGSDRIPRLFHRGAHSFSQVKVHEGVMPTARSQRVLLPGGIDHFTAPDFNTRIDKMRDYSELAAPTARVLHPFVVVLRALYTFAKSYLLQLGCMDGWRGLVIAWCAASGVFFKYMKAYSLRAQANEAHRQWRRRKNRRIKEAFADGGEVAVRKSWTQRAVWMRARQCDDLSAFLDDPDSWMTRGEAMKQGRSTTLVRARFASRALPEAVIIKRYNKKTIARGLRRCVRVSKGRICWRNAHLLPTLGIETPAPIAFVEKRWGPLRLDSFYVCEYSDAPITANKYRDRPPSETEIEWFRTLFGKMRRARLYHRDPNAHNFLVGDSGVAMLDLDSVVDCSSWWRRFGFARRFDKARRRFLRDWRNHPQQLARFAAAFADEREAGNEGEKQGE